MMPEQHAGGDRNHPDRREEILAAAARSFEKNGYAQTTMEEVAAEAGISKGSIYNYFKGKRDLFLHLVTQILQAEQGGVEDLLAGSESARETIERVIDHWAGRLEDFRHIGRLVLEFWAAAAREGHAGPLAASFQQSYRHFREMLADVLRDGVSRGEFPAGFDPRAGASLIMAALDGAMVQLILEVGIDVDDQFIGFLKQSVLGGPGGAATDEPEDRNEK